MEAFGQLVPLILIFGIMYFLLIRPQQKKAKEHQAMVKALRRGDQVITQGGLIGKVSKVKEENELEVELAENVKVRVVQSTIVQVLNKTEPAKEGEYNGSDPPHRLHLPSLFGTPWFARQRLSDPDQHR